VKLRCILRPQRYVGAVPERILEVVAADAGQRLDVLLRRHHPALGRAAIRRLIEAGQARLCGRTARAGTAVQTGDRIVLRDWPDDARALPDPALGLSVVHQDASLLVVDKPAAMDCHPLRPGEVGTLAGALLAHDPGLAQVGDRREAGLIHRLDRDTSGLLLVARDARTFAALRADLAAGRIDKRYLALCPGRPRLPACHRAELRARGPRVTVRSEPFAGSLPITTELLGLEPHGDHSLVSVRAPFARRHQIRAHLAFLGHPIVGDRAYGGDTERLPNRHFLHASELRLTHPESGRPLHLRSALPPELQVCIGAC